MKKKVNQKEELSVFAINAKKRAVDLLIEIGSVVANAVATVDIQERMNKLQSVVAKYNNYVRKIEEVDNSESAK